MRFLHTSDWHLGIQLHSVPLLDEQRAFAEFLAKTIKLNKVDAVVIAGDVFDHAISTPESVRLYSKIMNLLCSSCNVPVLICAGNHDGAARLSLCAPLLRSAGLFVAGSLSDGVEPIVLDDTLFFLLPYFNADEARCIYPDRNIRGASDAMKVVCDELREKFIKGKRHILVSHCFAAGGEPAESDRTAVLGTASRVSLEAFAGFDYVALGHLHRAQELRHGDTILRYSGTPYPYSFGEMGEKSFTIVDTKTMQLETIPIVHKRTVRVLSGEYETILEQAQFDLAKDDYMKIVLTDCSEGIWRMSQLREQYPNLLVLNGIAYEGQSGTEMTLEALEALRPEDLVRHFCEECGGFSLDEELMEIFHEAAQSL